MSAREDYPIIAGEAKYWAPNAEYNRVLDEIDHLRSDVANLLTMCSEAGIEWPEARFALGGGAPGQDVAS